MNRRPRQSDPNNLGGQDHLTVVLALYLLLLSLPQNNFFLEHGRAGTGLVNQNKGTCPNSQLPSPIFQPPAFTNERSIGDEWACPIPAPSTTSSATFPSPQTRTSSPPRSSHARRCLSPALSTPPPRSPASCGTPSSPPRSCTPTSASAPRSTPAPCSTECRPRRGPSSVGARWSRRTRRAGTPEAPGACSRRCGGTAAWSRTSSPGTGSCLGSTAAGVPGTRSWRW